MIAALLAALIVQDGASLDQFRDRQRAATEALTPHTPVEPADWVCANPLIARNYSQRVDTRQLALRIADECTRPYRARPMRTEGDRIFENSERTTYGYGVTIFQGQIEQHIQQARRRDAIKLN